MSDVTAANWYNNLDPALKPAFNTAAFTTLAPSEIIFGAAEAYREAQEAYNSGTSVSSGNYINFVSPLVEDAAPSIDPAGDFSKNRTIILRAKVVYTPKEKLQPQNSVTII